MESGKGKAAYRVTITTAAMRDLKKLNKSLDRRQLARIDAAICALGDNPRPVGYEPLEGMKDVFRIREGDHRILYSIDDEQHFVRIARVRHRRDVYKP